MAPDEPLISDYERKRRDRESSPSFKAAAAKRLRPDEPEGFSGPSSASGGEAYAGGGPSAYAATAVPPAHPSFIPTNNGLMPPPRYLFISDSQITNTYSFILNLKLIRVNKTYPTSILVQRNVL